jgi:hypothetical protein
MLYVYENHGDKSEDLGLVCIRKLTYVFMVTAVFKSIKGLRPKHFCVSHTFFHSDDKIALSLALLPLANSVGTNIYVNKRQWKRSR